jgi:FkbM family methyltransferase
MTKYTQFHGEIQEGKHVDRVLRDYFGENYVGTFFDVGAFHPITISNSYHFEKNDWACYLFEANPNNIPLLKQVRKNVFHYAISDEDKDSIEFNVVTLGGDWTASYSAITISEEYERIFGRVDPSCITKVNVPLRTLNTIIKNEIPDLSRIDIMSIDIEGGEYNCLKGLDIEKYKPKVIVIEIANSEDKTISNYLKTFGYRLDKKVSYNEYYLADDFIPPKP